MGERDKLALVMDVSDAIDLRCEIAPWLVQCSYCDGGLAANCSCPRGDVRALLLRIYNALGDPYVERV